MSNFAMKNSLQMEKNVLLCIRKLTLNQKNLFQKIFSKKLFLNISQEVIHCNKGE